MLGLLLLLLLLLLLYPTILGGHSIVVPALYTISLPFRRGLATATTTATTTTVVCALLLVAHPLHQVGVLLHALPQQCLLVVERLGRHRHHRLLPSHL
jgi:hypothetical protein